MAKTGKNNEKLLQKVIKPYIIRIVKNLQRILNIGGWDSEG